MSEKIVVPEQSIVLQAEEDCRNAITAICERLQVTACGEVVVCPPMPAQSRVYMVAKERLQSTLTLPHSQDMVWREEEAMRQVQEVLTRHNCIALAMMKLNVSGGVQLSPVFCHWSRAGLVPADQTQNKADKE